MINMFSYSYTTWLVWINFYHNYYVRDHGISTAHRSEQLQNLYEMPTKWEKLLVFWHEIISEAQCEPPKVQRSNFVSRFTVTSNAPR